MNGQHRCAAVVESGVSIMVVRAFDVPDDTFDVMDTGGNRTGSDILSISGITNPTRIAPIARTVINWLQGNSFAKNPTVSNAQLLRFALANRSGLEHTMAQSLHHEPKASVIGAVHFLFARLDRSKADSFVRDYRLGANLGEWDPALRLREKFRSQQKTTVLNRAPVLEWTIACFNARFLDEPMKRLPSTKSNFDMDYRLLPFSVPDGVDIAEERRRQFEQQY
jgi:hypothetical protein